MLRLRGLPLSTAQVIDFVRGLEEVDIGNRADVRFVGLATLTSDPAHIAILDSTLNSMRDEPIGNSQPTETIALADPHLTDAGSRELTSTDAHFRGQSHEDKAGEKAESDSRFETKVGRSTYSPLELLRHKDFSHYSESELEAARRFLRAISWNAMTRRSGRRRPDKHGDQIDMRRLLQHTFRNWGEIRQFPRRGPTSRPRRLVIICDISGSMERYTRILLHFLHAVGSRLSRTEVFVFGTQLTRITNLVRRKDVDEAISLVTREVRDWSGGTRIGDALGVFNRSWVGRTAAHGSVVVIISDGWDRGDVDRIGAEMRRLQRVSRRLIWLNPLLGSPAYEPLTQGLQAALPYIDDFLPAHNVASLQSLAQVLNDRLQGPKRRRQLSRRLA